MSSSTFSMRFSDSNVHLYRRIAEEIKKADTSSGYSRTKEAFKASKEKIAKAILPLLVGSDLVVDEKGDRLEVRKINPTITIKPYLDHFKVISSLRTDDRGILQKKVSSEGRVLSVMFADKRQEPIIKRLLAIDTLPLEARKDLVAFAEQVKNIISIDTLALEKLGHAQGIQGTGKIVIRIKPSRDIKNSVGYNMIAAAMPCSDEYARFTPGRGPTLFVTEKKGEQKIVFRDLQAEEDNFRRLAKKVTSLSGSNSSLQTPENLLKLLEFVSDNPEDYVIEWPRGEEIKFRGRVDRNTWPLFVSTGTLHQWFSIVGNCSVGGVQLPARQLVSAVQQNPDGEYIRLGENDYLKMSKELKKQIEALAAICQEKGDGLVVPKFFIGQLADIVGSETVGGSGDAAYRDLLQKVKDAYASTPEVPQGLNGTLRDYQVTGYRWMSRLSSWGAGACLADDMGLGKTVQTIAFLLSKASEGASLVIAPTTVLSNWKSELKRFAPSLNPIVLNDEPDRVKTVEGCGKDDVLLCSYGILTTCGDILAGKQWNVICLDEAHQIKNRFTKVSEAAMSLVGSHRVILTGTPLQNDVSELWNLMQFLNPGLLGTFRQFSEKFGSISGKSPGKKEAQEKAMEQLKTMTQPFILRRTKDEVVRELPARTKIDYMVPLTDREMAAYEERRQEVESFYDTVKPNEVMKFFFGDLNRLRRMACSMALENANWGEEASKIRELRYLLNGIVSEDNNIVIFSQYTSFLVYVQELLRSMGLPFLYLDGSTPMNRRDRIIGDFQSGKIPIFVCSLKVGGIGINLTAANYVIMLDPWWNPAIEQQAMDRAYRIGQTRDVTVIRMVSYHTIEEKVTRLQESKLKIATDLLDGASASASLSYDDIKEMLSSF